MKTKFAGIQLKNFLVASSSPLTESVFRLKYCRDAGFGAAILKSAAPYNRSVSTRGRKVVYIKDGYLADAPFEREILSLDDGLSLYKEARKVCGEMLVIPSVSGSFDAAFDATEWISACKHFEDAGAKLIQLDFFYISSFASEENFYEKFGELLRSVSNNLSCGLMPKINVNFDAEKICGVLAECGIEQVSLLDSIRAKNPEKYGLTIGTTSYFGRKQLPITLKYLVAAKSRGLEVCAGGGADSREDVGALLENGADLVQTASYVLKRGFSSVPVLLGGPPRPELSHHTWCDKEEGAPCENCGACRA